MIARARREARSPSLAHGDATLRYLRSVAGYRTWKDLCAAEGLAIATLHRLLAGQSVGERHLERLAQALRISPRTLRTYLDARLEERAESRRMPIRRPFTKTMRSHER